MSNNKPRNIIFFIIFICIYLSACTHTLTNSKTHINNNEILKICSKDEVRKVLLDINTKQVLKRVSEKSIENMATFQCNKRIFFRIYTKYLKKDSSIENRIELAGKILFGIKVYANGKVEDVTVNYTTIENDQFISELTNSIKKYNFLNTRGSTYEFVYPVRFVQQENGR